MIRLILAFSIFGAVLFIGCTTKEKKIVGEDVIAPDAKPQTFQKIAPLTSNALGARKNLHENGWKFIPSTKKSLAEVKKSGRMSFKTAKAMIFVSLKKRASDYPGDLGDTMNAMLSLGKNEEEAMHRVSMDIYKGTYDLAKWELDASAQLFKESGDKFLLGYMSLGKTTKEDTAEIFGKMAEYNGKLHGNYKSLTEMFADTSKSSGERISSSWKGAYRQSILEWDKKYKESGEKSNSVLALWDIFAGYTIALKEIALSPLAGTAMGAGEFVGGTALTATGYTATAAGQTLVTTGMTVFYAGKTGYNVLSPSLESGFLGTVGIASAAATVPTAVTGVGVGAFNQVTAVAGANTARAAGTAGGIAYETGAAAAGMVYDFGKGTGESVIYGLKSGVVLSYAALTAIPAHLLITVPDGTVFLAWDGPRLVIAVVRGNYKGFDNLPTGSIVDLEEAKKAGKVEILTNDEAVVKKVMEKEIQEREDEMKRNEKKEGENK